MSSQVILNGGTSGSVIVTCPDVAGSNTITFPAATGTVALDYSASAATTFLGADVNLNNTASWFNGPNTGSIGAAGQKWQITIVAALKDTAGVSFLEAAIFDGTNYLATGQTQNFTASAICQVTATIVVTLSGPTTFTLRARDSISTSGVLLTTAGSTAVNNKATSITAVRIG